jgi:hypothetical protein
MIGPSICYTNVFMELTQLKKEDATFKKLDDTSGPTGWTGTGLNRRAIKPWGCTWAICLG